MKIHSLRHIEDFSRSFNSLPRWLCPDCQKCYLISEGVDEYGYPIHSRFTSEKNSLYLSEGYIDPEELTDTFSMSLKCGDRSCGERVLVVGDLDHFQTQDGWSQSFYPTSLHPPVPPFPFKDLVLPDWLPPEIIRSSMVFWPDHKSTLTIVRHIAENVMDDLGVPREKSPRKYYEYRDRVKMISPRPNRDIIVSSLEKIRSIGNHSAHGSLRHITKDNAANIFPALESLILSVYEQESDVLLAEEASNRLLNAISGKSP